MEIHKIVVAYDGSRQSQKALEWAVGLALKLDSEVISVTAVKPPEFSPTISEIEEFYSDSEKKCQPIIDKVRQYGAEMGIEIKAEVLRGHPAESIVKYAFEKKADLIVTGTRGMGGFKNLVIGSVAQKVVTYSQVPVTVIK